MGGTTPKLGDSCCSCIVMGEERGLRPEMGLRPEGGGKEEVLVLMEARGGRDGRTPRPPRLGRVAPGADTS